MFINNTFQAMEAFADFHLAMRLATEKSTKWPSSSIAAQPADDAR